MNVNYESITNLLRLLPEPAITEVAEYAEYLFRKHVRLAVSEPMARRKANNWLITWVGNMVMADQPQIVYVGERPVWRFGAFITSLSHYPRGPIGYVEVDTATGEILSSEEDAKAMQHAGEILECSLSSTA